MEPPKTTLPDAIKQIERWCYVPELDENKKPTGRKVPDPKKLKEYLEGLYHSMDYDVWLELANVYKDIALKGYKRSSQKRRGRPAGKYAGLTPTERYKAEKKEAQLLGVWHVRYTAGCTECGSPRYKHASGGICTRCVSLIRQAGLTVKEYRKGSVK
jgi:hypothetical protein